MKKYHFTLIGLIIVLLIQVINTCGLYFIHSNQTGVARIVVSLLAGVGFEVAIFICIFCGEIRAGKFFAILMFFIGIMFHDSWDGFILNFHRLGDPVYLSMQKKFFATTLFQIVSSILVYFLSEKYVQSFEFEFTNSDLKKLLQQHSEAKQKYNTLITELSDHEKHLSDVEQEIADRELYRSRLDQEVITLKKMKASASRGVSVDL